MSNLRLDPVPAEIVGHRGPVCFSCFGMGQAGTTVTLTRWAYGDALPIGGHVCDICYLDILDRLTAYAAAHGITRRPR